MTPRRFLLYQLYKDLYTCYVLIQKVLVLQVRSQQHKGSVLANVVNKAANHGNPRTIPAVLDVAVL
jgi:hypothetical protein